LSQLLLGAADAISTLLPPPPPVKPYAKPNPKKQNSDIGMITAKFYNQDGTPSTTVQTGARVFEEKAQDWFATLNVSFSL